MGDAIMISMRLFQKDSSKLEYGPDSAVPSKVLSTMPLMTILARRPFFAQGHKWSGLDPKSLGVKAPLRRVRRMPSSETKEA